MEFRELESLNRGVSALRETHASALREYYSSPGFRHKYGLTEVAFSKASTSTCVVSLAEASLWRCRPWWPDTKSLFRELIKEENWKSAGLSKGNPFTVAFIAEALAVLQSIDPSLKELPGAAAAVATACDRLNKALVTTAGGGVGGAANISPYPPTTFLTQLVVRVLRRLGRLDPAVADAARTWGWSQVQSELVLVSAGSQTADSFSLAYAIMVVSLCSQPATETPEESLMLRHALESVFDRQQPDGTWPRSRPLFHYPKFGNAYCYDFEMLAQLLSTPGLQDRLLLHLDKLRLSVNSLRDSAHRFQDGSRAWASGHNPQLRGPESWSTASVYHFLFLLDRLLAEAIRRALFDYMHAEYSEPSRGLTDPDQFASDLLDSDLDLRGETVSLRSTVFGCLVEPVQRNKADVEMGLSLPKHVPVSAILFGPPGTSKTTLATKIAEFLGWPLLSIDPSHLVRHGLDQIQAEANRLFGMLAAAERVVVLLDEFDEMLRERVSDQSEALSRFLTTAMLPKLSLINERRRIVFIVATNHIEHFDFAIRRHGRFDAVIQVMPPSLREKLRQWPRVEEDLDTHQMKLGDLQEEFAKLTYDEFAALAHELARASTGAAASRVVQEATKRAMMNQEVRDGSGKWEDLSKKQSSHCRFPSLAG